MILDGGQRGGARDLAHHLMKAENEHIEVHEIRGFIAETVMGALREAEAVSRGTRCAQFLYSLSLSPPERERVAVTVFDDAIERIETKLGLDGHPRVVLFHEKNGRRHAHCVWSRIDGETMKAVRMSHDRRKLGDISRQLYIEHGWKMPEGLIDAELRNPLNFDRKEWFQAQRTGKNPRDIKAAFQQCWHASESGAAFRSALEQRGYWLARGDRRVVVAVDVHGEVYAVARWVGLKTRDVASLADDLEALPTVPAVRKHVASLVNRRMACFIDSASEEFARAAQLLEGQRGAMVERHRKARQNQRMMHEDRAVVETRNRAERFRKGVLGLWDRVTGKHSELRRRNELEAAACTQRDVAERETLIASQLEERQSLQREIDRERRIHVRRVALLYRQMATDNRSFGLGEREPVEKALLRLRDSGSRRRQHP